MAKMINGIITLSDSERIELRQKLMRHPNNPYRYKFLSEVDKMDISPTHNGFTITWRDDT